jgi:hypothetical protein
MTDNSPEPSAMNGLRQLAANEIHRDQLQEVLGLRVEPTLSRRIAMLLETLEREDLRHSMLEGLPAKLRKSGANF